MLEYVRWKSGKIVVWGVAVPQMATELACLCHASAFARRCSKAVSLGEDESRIASKNVYPGIRNTQFLRSRSDYIAQGCKLKGFIWKFAKHRGWVKLRAITASTVWFRLPLLRESSVTLPGSLQQIATNLGAKAMKLSEALMLAADILW